MKGLSAKKYAGAVFALLLLLFLCGVLSLPVRALAKADPAAPLGPLPTLIVSCANERLAAKSGSNFWGGSIGDAVHPMSAQGKDIALPTLPLEAGARFLPLVFAEPPQSVTAKHYAGARGTGVDVFSPVEYRDGVLLLPAEKAEGVYEIHAKWQSGNVTYFVAITADTAAFWMTTQEPCYNPKAQIIGLTMINNGTTELGYGSPFWLERLENGSWSSVRALGEILFPSWGTGVPPGKTDDTQVSVGEILGVPAPVGFYRVRKPLLMEGTPILHAEFEIGTPDGSLAIGTPAAITVTYTGKNGKPVAATLTRKGKYEGSSPLVYVTERLRGLPAATEGTTPAALATEKLLLAVRDADGTERRMILSKNGTVETGGRYFSAQSSLFFDSIKAVAVAFAGK